VSPWISRRFLRSQSDERLLAAAGHGHARAFEMLVERHRGGLLACAHRVLGAGRAEDALQQGLLHAWVALERGTHVRNPRAWLFRVVHNTAVDMLRDTRPAQALPSDSLRVGASLEADVELQETVRDTLTHIAALPDVQREALLRTTLDGHSHERVGSALGVSADAVRGLVYRARSSLRAAASVLLPPQLVELAASLQRRFASLRLVGLGQGGGSQAFLERGAAVISAGALVAGVATATGQFGTRPHHPRLPPALHAERVERSGASAPHGPAEESVGVQTAGTGAGASGGTGTDGGARERSARPGTASTQPLTNGGATHTGGSGSGGGSAKPEGEGDGRQGSSSGSAGDGGGGSGSGGNANGSDGREGQPSESPGVKSEGNDAGPGEKSGVGGSPSGGQPGNGGGSGSDGVPGDGGSGSGSGSGGERDGTATTASSGGEGSSHSQPDLGAVSGSSEAPSGGGDASSGDAADVTPGQSWLGRTTETD
jgi:RNA polymerase sigma factor (sigma-70 family)